MKQLARPLRGLASRFSRKFQAVLNSALAKIEGDFVVKPGVQMIAKIAKVLGVSVEDLLR